MNANQEYTLPKYLRLHYQKYGDSKVALREKDRGVWKEYTWADYYSIVKRLSLALLELGIEKGDKVAVLGENKPHVYWYELAAQVNRASVVGVFSDCTPPEVKYFVQHSDSTFVVCQDQEQVDKLLEIKDEIPLVKKVIYWEEKGMWDYDDPLLITVDRMLEIGEEYDRRHPDKFERMIDETDVDDIALFFYTSGTTGLPKAAMVSHRSVIGMGNTLGHGIAFDDTDESLSYLPIAWITEQILNVVCSLLYGFTVNFPETQETVQENIREIGPTVLMLGPRAWEGHIKTIRVKILNAKWINRLFFNPSIKVGKIVGDAAIQGKRAALGWRIIQRLADMFVFRPLRDRLGMSRTRWAITGGTAISPDVFNYFHSIGVPLTQMYGSSEIGAVSVHRRGRVKPETCGPPLEGYEIKISDEGEVQVRCPYLFQGYYKAPDKINEVVRDGWYQTGDFGRIDEAGHLIVMDRMADLKPISGDKFFSPQYAETRLRFSPFIKDAVVAGIHEIDYAVAIIIIDYDNVGQWAEANHITYTTYSDLSRKKESVELVRQEIAVINAYLPEWARIEKFINLHKEFDPDEAELTRTRKVRRDFLEDKYGEIIEALVGGKTNLTVTASVTYRDGTTSELESSVSINKVNK